jgi:hypothetical protein
VVEGDVARTVPAYFRDHPETIVALAYFDLAVYEPTKACLLAIKPHLVSGSVIMLDEFNSRDYPGETVAFKEVFRDVPVTFQRSRYMTDRTFLVVR